MGGRLDELDSKEDARAIALLRRFGLEDRLYSLGQLASTIPETLAGSLKERLTTFLMAVFELGGVTDENTQRRIAKMLQLKPGFELVYVGETMDGFQNCERYVLNEDPAIYPVNGDVLLTVKSSNGNSRTLPYHQFRVLGETTSSK